MFTLPVHSLMGCVFILGTAFKASASDVGTPQVTVKNGTYGGIHSPSYNQDFFLGMPYALPPTRFSASEPLKSSWTGVKNATEFGNICYGYGSDSVRLANLGFTISEDCLSINVVRPSGYNDTLLPVGVYIHGGGYYMGGSSDPRLNFSSIVNNSLAANVPMIAVSLNYRLSGFGFLGGSEIVKAEVGNLGFRDQRLALQWLQENIAAFGGDPTKVTIWGNSAGAGSVGAHLLAYGGRDDGLFSQAISESGSPAGFSALSEFLPVATWDEVYANLTTGTGCQDATDTLECLRKAPIEVISDLFNSSKASGAATTGANYGPILDGDFVADVPTRQMERGEFIKVPYLMGSNTDEGSSFIPGNNVDFKTNYPTSKIDNDAQFFADLESLRLNETTVAKFAELYPQNGSEQTVANYHNTLPAELGIQYKRGVTFYGDSNIVAPTRYAAIKWSDFNVTAFKYRWNVIVAGLPAFIGATHAKEMVFVFDDTKGWDYDVYPFLDKPQSYYNLGNIISTAWATFIATGNPNGQNGVNGTLWPKYDTETPQNFVFDTNVTSYVEPDTFREDAIAYMMELYSQA